METNNTRARYERAASLLGVTDERYRPVAAALWGCTLLFYAVGDTGLTVVVLELGGVEANSVAQAFYAAGGYMGLVVQKLLALAVLWVIWRYYPAVGSASPDPWRLIVPAIPFLRGIQLVTLHTSNISALL
jgi:hypothetical protein